MSRATTARLLAVALTSVAASVGAAVAPAHAATCANASGVSVVVDFGALGGGVQTKCDPGSGQAAWDQFVDQGFPLETVQRQPGFVCRVSNLPGPEQEACVDTPPEDAYWGLFWSDGKSGAWQYSSVGAASLKVPEGGSVALAWQNSDSQRQPGAAPPKHTSPTPSPEPTTPPSDDGGGAGTGDGGGAGSGGGRDGDSAATSPSASPSQPSAASPSASSPSSKATPRAERAAPTKKEREQREAKQRDKRDRQKTASAETTDAESATATQPPADAAADDSGRVPTWVTAVVLGVLAFVALLSVMVRRRLGGRDAMP
jgi:hypothetical protein